MLYLLWYIVAGLIIIYGGAIIHLIRAEIKGYAAIEWWTDNGSYINQYVTGTSFIFGLLIWPMRIYSFCIEMIPQLYELYELK